MSADSHAMGIVYRAMRAKDEWFIACSKKYLPPIIVRCAESKRGLDLCAKYIDRHGFVEEQWTNGWRYFKKGTLYLGAFRFVIKGSRITITAVVFNEPVSALPDKFRSRADPNALYPAFDE